MAFRETTARGDPSHVVAAARKLGPQIRAARDEIEAQRQTPSAIASAMADAGLYQMFLARSAGGPELPPLTVFAAIEELSRADGSIGWCAMIGSANALLTGWLRPETVRAMAGTPADLRLAGSLRPQGRAWPVGGGYRVNGQWNFASGIDHATWLHCPCVLMDGETPRVTPAGTPATRVMWVPADAATIIDTWSVMGMRGTASQDFVLKDRIVPSEYTSSLAEPPFQTGPLYQSRAMFVALWATTVANALGIARAAIDDFIELATREASTMSTALLRDRPLVQTSVARAEAIRSAAMTRSARHGRRSRREIRIPRPKSLKPGLRSRTACMRQPGRSIWCSTLREPTRSTRVIRSNAISETSMSRSSMVRQSRGISNRLVRL